MILHVWHKIKIENVEWITKNKNQQKNIIMQKSTKKKKFECYFQARLWPIKWLFKIELHLIFNDF